MTHRWVTIALTRIFGMCAMWPSLWRSWHTLTTINVWNSNQITWQWGVTCKARSGNLGYEGMCALWLSPEDITLGQRYDTLFGHGKYVCELLSRSNLAVMIYRTDTDLRYMFSVSLTLEIRPWVKGTLYDTPLCYGQQLCDILSRSTFQWGGMSQT